MSHPVSIPLHRPLVERWAQDLVELVVRAWRQRRARRDLERRIDAMADLSPSVLRDIGAADDLLSQAAARRQAEAQCLEELRIVANHRGLDSRFW